MLKIVKRFCDKNVKSVRMLMTKDIINDKCNMGIIGKITINYLKYGKNMHKPTKKITFFHIIKTNSYSTICYILV